MAKSHGEKGLVDSETGNGQRRRGGNGGLRSGAMPNKMTPNLYVSGSGWLQTLILMILI